MSDPSIAYPSEDVTLRDGTQVTLRAIRPDDAPRLQALASRLSPQSMYQRALVPLQSLSEGSARRLAHVDYANTMALVATRAGEGGEDIVGVARYARVSGAAPDPGEAEAAVVVEDRYHRRGLGSLLLARLTAYARSQGIYAFLATVLPDNEPVLSMIRRTGLRSEWHSLSPGELQLRIELLRPADE